ncbi:calmodulin-regulated spectrin-associated protein 3 isoform X2 [Struthio camelus]|uniref:calmodulin-regulated spectrin-associated protein 3 isoform X2 n=1 Tax=Struthio camelus TaxID=8801 RepID=UPI00360411B1
MVAAPPAAAEAMRRGFLVPEIRPLDQYDGARARSAASLAWAIATGYGGAGNVPEELRDPFYTDQYEQEHIKPPVTRLLVASDIYCRAWRHALGPPEPPATAPTDNGALLALLAHRGLPPTFQDAPVREADLHHKPIKMGAHLAVIDSLMTAFVAEATRALGTPPGAEPGSWEPKILCWVDTVNRKLQESTERDGTQRPAAAPPDGPAAPSACGHKCPTRWYWKLVPHAIAFCLKESGNKPPVIRYRKDKVPPRQTPCFPPVVAMKDLASGGAIAATIHYYCPDALRLEDVCLKETMSVADSLYNLQLIQDFCTQYLGTRCPLALEDLLYMPPALKINVGVFLAELFLCFEVLRPAFVRPKDLGGLQESPGASEALTPNSSSPVFNFRHPLLPGGQPPTSLRGPPGTLHHSPSLSHVEGAFGKTWSKKPLSHPLSQAVSFSIPFGLDSDVDIVMGNPVGATTLARSASTDSLAPAPRRRPGPPPLTPSPNPAAPLPNGLADASPELPTIEEALQIIHSSERLVPEGAPDAFYLHSPEPPPPENAPKSLPSPPKTRQAPPNGSALQPGVRMTSFAERKKMLEEAGGGAPKGPPEGAEAAAAAGDSPGRSPALTSEMSQLGARLEEKRRAIEAQKKRIEAIFAKHRQRLGKSAFLQLKRPEGAGPDRLEEDEEEEEEEEEDDGGAGKKQVTFSPEVTKGGGGNALEAELGGYNEAVAKLNTALSTLQLDMQRLSRQQERLLQDQRPAGGQAWVIPAPKGARGAGGGGGGGGGATTRAPASPSPSRKAPRSPQPAPRKAPPAAPRSPRRPRPAELRLPPLTRVLTPPHDVDTLPHLRKFSPSHVPVQTRSSIHFSEEEEEEEGPPPPDSPAAPHLEAPANLRPAGAARVSGDGTSDVSSPGERRASLIEVPLGDLRAEEHEGEGDSLEGSPTEGGPGAEPRASLGFFFKAEEKAEEEMAQKRASLLERQQRRSEEARRRRQWLEAERERKEREEAEARAPAEAPARTEEEGGRRGDFTRQEYERRQQLKLMADLDKVLRQRAPSARALRRGRPRSVFCDDSALARSPAKGLLGARLSKVYSQSTLSLSTVAAEPGSTPAAGRPPSRAASPSGPGSPGRPPAGREREWESASSASSPASGPDYTGPRLYKEPSAKSNKHIIHNALAHCCLAGRVNEPQKNRVLEEVEKSKANHFLILFRDGSCQFRALYTLGGDPPELSRLAGIGPRTVTLPMVEGIYKYNSDRKRFTQIPAKTMSMSVDAFTIQGHLWQPKKPGTPKKPSTPK